MFSFGWINPGKKTSDYLRFNTCVWLINFITLRNVCYNSCALDEPLRVITPIVGAKTLEDQMSIDKPIPQPENQPQENWHALTAEQIIRQLATPPETGLTSEEAARRLESYGPNQLTEAPGITFWQMLLDQFNNFVVIMLIIAAVISALFGDWIEAAAILLIVILNATLGVVQERRAEQALAALKKLAAPDAKVMRDGERKSVPSAQLVPGDIVLLEAGNYIPADIRLLEAANLRIEEAALTGESVPVQKDANIRLEADIPLGDRKNTTFMGTLVSYGRGRGVVVSTGMRTQIGLIAEMLQAVENEPTPLQKRLDQLGKTLGWATLAICGVVFVVSIIRFTDLSLITAPNGGLLVYLKSAQEEIINMFMLAVGLAIAAVPEGLPAVVTISLALGMSQMVQRHALIRKLSSVETLGSTTVICSDKTGTLTQNEMTLTRIWVDNKYLSITGKGRTLSGDFIENGSSSGVGRIPGSADCAVGGSLEQRCRADHLGIKRGGADLPDDRRPDGRGTGGGSSQSRRIAPTAQPCLPTSAGSAVRFGTQAYDHSPPGEAIGT